MEKYCINCGKRISKESEFCKYCGAAQSAKSATLRPDRNHAVVKTTTGRTREREASKKELNVVRIVVVVLVATIIIAACIFVTMWIRQKLEDKASSTNAQNTEQTQGETTVVDKTGDDEESSNKDTSSESDKNNNQDNDNSSKFKVGETYTVVADPNLMVRKGPSKDQSPLKRRELKGNDYTQSVGTTDEEDAALDKGSKVVCLEMSDKWMRIESGWICTEYDGEILVE